MALVVGPPIFAFTAVGRTASLMRCMSIFSTNLRVSHLGLRCNPALSCARPKASPLVRAFGEGLRLRTIPAVIVPVVTSNMSVPSQR